MKVIKKENKSYLEIKINTKGIIECPFCFEKHKHGKDNGHRIAHCIGDVLPVFFNGEMFRKSDGYFVNNNL